MHHSSSNAIVQGPPLPWDSQKLSVLILHCLVRNKKGYPIRRKTYWHLRWKCLIGYSLDLGHQYSQVTLLTASSSVTSFPSVSRELTMMGRPMYSPATISLLEDPPKRVPTTSFCQPHKRGYRVLTSACYIGVYTVCVCAEKEKNVNQCISLGQSKSLKCKNYSSAVTHTRLHLHHYDCPFSKHLWCSWSKLGCAVFLAMWSFCARTFHLFWLDQKQLHLIVSVF